METSNDAIEKLGDMIKDIRTAMLITEDEDGSLRARPMATQEFEFDGDLWFFTEEHSGKVDEVERDRNVCVTYVDAGKERYVSVSGNASLVRDRAKMEELWNPMLKAWFKGGLEDPELALIKVRVQKAEFWDGPGSKVVELFSIAKAALTGSEYDAGEHAKVDLSR
jgi:general stress protein 26